VTIAGVARGLGRPVERHPTIESQLRAFFGGEVDEARLKMAEVVRGTELLFEGTLKFPLFQVENIYILPGIPELFREKFSAIRERFSVDPFYLRTIYTMVPETSIAPYLNRTVADYPELLLGSYPKLNSSEYRVRVTLESKDQAYLQRAFDALMAMLPPEMVVKTE
jgi:molybdopterin-biosynthesis enzyme MoeA-like protein